MKSLKELQECNLSYSMVKTIKRNKLMSGEPMQFPHLDMDKLKTRRLGFNRNIICPTLNLRDIQQHQRHQRDSNTEVLLTERVRSGEDSPRKKGIFGKSTIKSNKKIQEVKLPRIDVKNSSIKTCEIKRKRSNTYCKIIIPKNCPFPFSNKVRTPRAEKTQETILDEIDLLGMDLDISRITQIEQNMPEDNLRLYSRESIQQIPIF